MLAISFPPLWCEHTNIFLCLMGTVVCMDRQWYTPALEAAAEQKATLWDVGADFRNGFFLGRRNFFLNVFRHTAGVA
jgi:hypothetical protein